MPRPKKPTLEGRGQHGRPQPPASTATLRDAERSLQGALTVAIEQVRPDPQQPRRGMDGTRLAELAASLRTYGILQPLLVREDGYLDDGRSQFMVIAGARRYAAAQQAGLTRVPVIVRDSEAEHVRAMQLVENIQREALDVVQEAVALRELMELRGLTMREVAEIIGRSINYVQRRLEMLFDERIVDAVREGRLSASTAAEMKALPRPVRDAAVARVASGETLDVAEIRRLKRGTQARPTPGQEDAKRATAVLDRDAPAVLGEPAAPREPSRDEAPNLLNQYFSPGTPELQPPPLAAPAARAARPAVANKRIVAEHDLEVVSLLRTHGGHAPAEDVLAALRRDVARLERPE